jgi:hypothetical protein
MFSTQMLKLGNLLLLIITLKGYGKSIHERTGIRVLLQTAGKQMSKQKAEKL